MVSYLQFYSRKDVQKEILRSAKNREVAFQFGNKGFGKRPDILQFEGDVFELAKQGVTSFHISEEHWSNPLDLSTGMSKKQLDELRSGWDLIIDIDCKFLEYSKIIAYWVVEALKFYDLEDVSLKFSGNSGFHIGIPFDSFPKKVKNISTRLLFPDGPRIVASYLQELIKDHLAASLLDKHPIDKIAANIGKDKNDLLTGGIFNPFNVGDIDTILISSRHMFRAPFSFNEKSNLVSVPIKAKDLMKFDRDMAKPENVSTKLGFLDSDKTLDASRLIIQAFDREEEVGLRVKKKTLLQNEGSVNTFIYDGSFQKKEFSIPSSPIKADFFPPCILKIMRGIEEDGRKRALFILLNFLKSCGWNMEEIKNFVCDDWNNKNYEPLKEGYILSQISWHKRQAKNILPPNCENKSYYQDLRFCLKDGLCNKIKNPVNYSLRKFRLLNRKKRKKSSKR